MSTTFEQEHGFGVGSIIEYVALGGERRLVEVIAVDADIKNGRAGFDARMANDGDASDECHVWGYCSQVVKVVAR